MVCVISLTVSQDTWHLLESFHSVDAGNKTRFELNPSEIIRIYSRQHHQRPNRTTSSTHHLVYLNTTTSTSTTSTLSLDPHPHLTVPQTPTLSTTGTMSVTTSSNPISSISPSSSPITSVDQYPPSYNQSSPSQGQQQQLHPHLTLEMRHQRFVVERETLLNLPESVLLGMFPNGLILSRGQMGLGGGVGGGGDEEDEEGEGVYPIDVSLEFGVLLFSFSVRGVRGRTSVDWILFLLFLLLLLLFLSLSWFSVTIHQSTIHLSPSPRPGLEPTTQSLDGPPTTRPRASIIIHEPLTLFRSDPLCPWGLAMIDDDDLHRRLLFFLGVFHFRMCSGLWGLGDWTAGLFLGGV